MEYNAESHVTPPSNDLYILLAPPRYKVEAEKTFTLENPSPVGSEGR